MVFGEIIRRLNDILQRYIYKTGLGRMGEASKREQEEG
jgi:hypothetical protein